MTTSFALEPLHRFAEAHCADGSCAHAAPLLDLPLEAEPDGALREGLHRLADAIERQG